MNKKVTLSLLSATVFASMAASAFAAPTQGVYMGGSVDKFYKLDDLFNLTAEAKKQFVTNLNTANPDGDFNNLVFVDFDGKGAKFSEILAKGTLSKAKRDLTKTDFEGSYVTVNLDGSNGVSYDPRNDAVDVPTGDLKVESVSAIDANSFKVTFNKEVQAVLPANFVVTDKATGTRNYVQNAVLADDKKSATVTVYDALADGKAYVVETSGIKGADGVEMTSDSDEFTYTTPVPASISFKSTKLPVNAAVDLDNYIVVKDANGNELKSGYTVNYTSNATIGAGNTVDTRGISSLIVNATITKADNTTITTGNVVLGVEAAVATAINTFGLVDGAGKAVTTLFLNGTGLLADGTAATGTAGAGTLKLDSSFKDQYSEDIEVNDEVYESLTPTVLAVNNSTGAITPIQAGKALVRVTKGTLTKTIEIEVKANPTATTLEAVDTLTVVGSGTAPTGSFKLIIKDQYGNKVTTNDTVTITNSDATVATLSAPGTATAGELTVTVQGLKAGTTKVTLTVGTLKKEVTVTATAAGTVSGFAVEAADATIDLNTDANDADATIKVYEVDAAGNKIKDLTASKEAIAAANLQFILPESGSKVKAKGGEAAANVFVKADDATAGTTEVTVKSGTLTIGTVTINVVNTTDTVASRELVSPLVKVNTSELQAGFNLDAVAKNIKMTTKAGKVLGNEGADLVAKKAAIASVVTSNSKAVTVEDGTTVAAATVTGAAQTATLTVVFKDSTLAPVAFNVEVADVTAPTADETTPITVEDVDGSGTLNVGDKITIKFSEAVDASKITVANFVVDNDHILGNAAIANPGSDKQTFVITLGSTSTAAYGDTLTITKANVVDLAGNSAADDVTFTIPTV